MPLWRPGKPPYGTAIDRNDCLTTSLRTFHAANEGGGSILYDSIGSLNLTAVNFGTNNPWGRSAAGPGIVTSGAGATAGCWAPLPAPLRLGWPQTIVCGVRFSGAAGVGSSRVFGSHVTNTTAAPSAAICIYMQSVSTIGFGFANGSSGVFPANYVTFTANTDYVIGLTVTSSSWQSYINGMPSVGGTGSYSNPTWTANALMFFAGQTYFSTACGAAPMYWGGWWSRALSAAEHQVIGASPAAVWQIFRPQADPLEILSSPINLRSTQEPTRTLVLPTGTKLRSTQEPTRALVLPTGAKLRATQAPVRVLVQSPDAVTFSGAFTVGRGLAIEVAITNGGVAPATAISATLQVSADGATWYDTDIIFTAGTTAGARYATQFTLGICGKDGGDWAQARMKYLNPALAPTTIATAAHSTPA